MLGAGDKLPSKRGTAVDSLDVKSLPAPRGFPFPRADGTGAADGGVEIGSTA